MQAGGGNRACFIRRENWRGRSQVFLRPSWHQGRALWGPQEQWRERVAACQGLWEPPHSWVGQAAACVWTGGQEGT